MRNRNQLPYLKELEELERPSYADIGPFFGSYFHRYSFAITIDGTRIRHYVVSSPAEVESRFKEWCKTRAKIARKNMDSQLPE